MASQSRSDRVLNDVYAGLSPIERARLLARASREQDGREVERLRRTVPTPAAGVELERGMRVIDRLYGAPISMLVVTRLSIERQTLLLAWAGTQAISQHRTWISLLSLWSLINYPVTASEYAAIVAIEREQLKSLDSYVEGLAAFDGTEERLNAEVATLLQEQERSRAFNRDGGGNDGDEARDALHGLQDGEIPQRIRMLMDAAIEGGELPAPQWTEQGPMLPLGVLRDWGEGTSAETYELPGPVFCIPALELLGGGFAGWDIRPDDAALAVTKRRTALQHAIARLVRDATRVEEAVLAVTTLDPPRTIAERERVAAIVQQCWPWRLDGVQDELRTNVRQQAQYRAGLQAMTNVVANLEREVFGGEDLLDPDVRELLDGTWQAALEFAEGLAAIADWLATLSLDEDRDWPPSLEDPNYLAERQRELEQHLLGTRRA